MKYKKEYSEEFLNRIKNSEKYVALHLPSSREDLDKFGFDTEEKAWEYIGDNLCDLCKKDLKNGGTYYGDEEIEENWNEMDHPYDTSCGAEWLVILEKDYFKADELDDLLKSAGMEKIEDDVYREKKRYKKK